METGLTSSAQWGFHPGGWGKPPMDDFNRPLYGDVFGVLQGAELGGQEQIDRSLWGEIEPIEGMSILSYSNDSQLTI
jgi:splicing factor 3B subunit 2